MTTQQIKDELFPLLGVYGDWLADHATKLNKSDPLVISIIEAYGFFREFEWYRVRINNSQARVRDQGAWRVITAIDEFCRERKYEPPASSLAHRS